MATKKLIEVALPLEKINEASAREKSIRHGHPSTLHLWWARRPLASTRAVIWASLIDDPSAHPEIFSTEEEQNKERERLFKILEELVVWENSNNEDILRVAKEEIDKSTDNIPPTLLDPFAGGGAIPLEAQRLGLVTVAHDLNPVSIMINKALLDIPFRFSSKAPINSDVSLAVKEGWNGASALAEDIRYYGETLRQNAFKKIGHLYPEVKITEEMGERKIPVIAWLWTRTTQCSNPACDCEMPLASSYVLSRKKGNEAWVEPIVDGNIVRFIVHQGKCPKDKESPKQGRSALFKCPKCGEITTDDYVKQMGKAGKIGKKLMAIVGENTRGRIYLSPNIEHEMIANIPRPDNYPDGTMPTNPRWFSPPAFGLTNYSDIFTNRQLTALVTLSDSLKEIRKKVENDAISSGYNNDHIHLRDGGKGACAYAEAICIYLAFAIDRLANRSSTQCVWNRIGQKIEQTFGRQAIAMVWDYAESNIFGSATGSWSGSLEWIPKCVEMLPASAPATVEQFNAQIDCGLRNVIVSTDPPYYDNIGYADLSDFFYIWMRYALKDDFPELFSTMLVPKAEELIADQYRHKGGAQAAKVFFENGMLETCRQIYKYAKEDFPVTIYYAYRQGDTDSSNGGIVSSGWETMLTAIVDAGFIITGTWPMRTERETGLKAHVNALASSIVLVCRKRSKDSPVCTRRNFINELKRELRPALHKLQVSNIAPVDLAQSAIGPGMGVYSKYKQVLEADGTQMTVRSALQIINQELDLYFNEQDGELDTESRFCIDLYSQNAFNEIPFGDANTLATAKNTSVAIMASHGTLYAQKGKVHLIERPELPTSIRENEGSIWLLCQQLTYKMEKEGIEGCAVVISNMFGSNAERAKDLAYRLYTIAERKKWAQEAYAYNALVVAWPEIQSRAAALKAMVPQQMTLEDFMNNNE